MIQGECRGPWFALTGPGQERPVFGELGMVWAIAPSPDGNRLAFLRDPTPEDNPCAGADLVISDLTSGRERSWPVPDSAPSPRMLSWSPDSRQLVVRGGGCCASPIDVRLLDLTARDYDDARVLAQPAGCRFTGHVGFRPDGHLVLVGADCESAAPSALVSFVARTGHEAGRQSLGQGNAGPRFDGLDRTGWHVLLYDEHPRGTVYTLRDGKPVALTDGPRPLAW